MSIEEILKVKKGEDIKRESQYLYNADLVLPSPSLKSYAYSADTRYFEEMLNYVKDVDLLYHEATFTEKHIERAKKTMHSTAREAALIAKGANVKHLILGHFSARFKNTDEVLAEANSVFDNVCCVEDGDEFVL